MSLSKSDLYDLQMQREIESMKHAREDQRKANDALHSSGQNSKSIGGMHLHDQIIQSAISLMAEDLSYYFRNKNASTLPVVYSLLLNNYRVSPYIEPDEMAHISLVTILDSIGDGMIPTVPTTKVFAEVGSRIEDQARMNFVQMVEPKYFKKLKEEHLKKATAYEKKMSRVRAEIEYREIENEDLEWDGWSREEQVAVGSWAVWIIQQSTTWFKEIKLPPSKNNPFGQTKYLMFSQSARDEMKVIEAMRLAHAYSCEPMIMKPLPWMINEDGSISRGGYIVEPPKQHRRLIHGFEVKTQPSQKAMDYINNVQSQGFRTNDWIREMLFNFTKGNHEIGSFICGKPKKKDLYDLPVDVWSMADTDPDKKAAFIVLMRYRSLEQKHAAQSLPNNVILSRLSHLQDENLDWFSPWFYDTRLRAYPVAQPHIQGTEWWKGSTLFADGAPVTRENFEEVKRVYLIAIANTYGHKMDKQAFDKRVEFATTYVNEKLEIILNRPTCEPSYSLWTNAEEPVQHLALLKEYKDVILNWRPGVLSHVPIGFDATCSGLQLLGSFVKDPDTCRLVNVTPSDTPQDAYGSVAAKAREILADPDRWRMLTGREDDESHDIPVNMIDRSVAKKVVMLIPYGGSYDTLVNHVRDATKDWNLKIRDSHTLTKALIQGMDEAVPGFFALNKWFKDVAKAILASGKNEIKWLTPTGSTIVQVYRKPETKQINTVALGVSNYKDKEHWASKHNEVIDDSKEGAINKRKNQTALAANWTHSMDAAVLQEAFHDFKLPFSTVHDCLYAPAGAIPEANRRIREAFVKVTSSEMLQAFLDINELDFPLPPIGDVDLSTALQSEYLFS